ncbi:MAG: DUF368 domain-containing protein [Firmicutes bacterium]|nr:DUF368 domain-containing protein [Bacillota bacterium]
MITRNEGFLYRLFAGLIIGLGMIIPGVSGGVIAIMLGLYHQVVAVIAHPLENFWHNVRFILPLAVGGIASVLLFSNVIEYLLINYPFFIMYLFIGLLLGSLPAVIDIANKKGFDQRYLVPFFITLILTLLPVIFEKNGVYPDLDFSQNISFGLIIISGFLLAIGTVVPGISSSFLLMMFGTYHTLLNAVAKLNLAVLIPVGIVFLVFVLIISRITHYLFQQYYGWTYYGLLGVLIGSVIVVFPGFPQNFVQGFSGILLFICGVIITLNLREN